MVVSRASVFRLLLVAATPAGHGYHLASATRIGMPPTDSQAGWDKLPAVDVDHVQTIESGESGTMDFRRFFWERSHGTISPWHDIPLFTETPNEYHMVTEVPKMTRAKFEIATHERNNPMAQDTKNGQLRDYHGPIYWNYGYMPQTWEDPTTEHPQLDVVGDNDPLDVVEIGSRVHSPGEVTRVRVLGALAMIDSGELDWKLIAIDVDDHLAVHVHSLQELEKRRPEIISGIREWFRWYKAPDQVMNVFGWNGKCIDEQEAQEVVAETHEAWKKLRMGQIHPGDRHLWLGGRERSIDFEDSSFDLPIGEPN